MIVKNESRVIERCLSSVRKYIDSWVIVDTGSTDGTQEIIRNTLKGIPGELHERPWVDFAYNRNEAMQLARGRGDYLLFIDADEVFLLEKGFFPPLDQDCYHAVNHLNQTESLRLFLVKQGIHWHWKGVLYEEIFSPQARAGKVLDGAVIVSTSKDGSRSRDPQKSEKDIQIMEKVLSKEPNNTRMLNFLALAYEATGKNKQALACHEKRAKLGGCSQEIYYCHLRSAVLKAKLDWPMEMVIQSFMKAYYMQPSRAEPQGYLADYMIKRENYLMGYLLASSSLSIPYPKEKYRVEFGIYKWGRLVQVAECAWRIGRIGETYEAIQRLLAMKDLPSDIREPMKKNSLMKIFDPYRHGIPHAFGGAL